MGSGGLVVEVAIWLVLGSSPSRIEEVVDELLHYRGMYLTESSRDKESGRALRCRHAVPD